MGGMDTAARGCGLAVLVMFAVFSIPGLYAVHKLAPCVTGEVTTTTAVSADGKILTATAPVCPEEGQTYVRAVGLALIVGTMIIVAVLGTLGFNGVENIGLGMVAIWKGQAPINATARDITPDSGRDAELHRLDVQLKEATVQLTAARAALGRQSLEDRQGWQTPMANGAGAAVNGNGTGNGHKPGGTDLAGFEVMG